MRLEQLMVLFFGTMSMIMAIIAGLNGLQISAWVGAIAWFCVVINAITVILSEGKQ